MDTETINVVVRIMGDVLESTEIAPAIRAQVMQDLAHSVGASAVTVRLTVEMTDREGKRMEIFSQKVNPKEFC